MAPLARPVEVPAELAAAMPAPFAEEQGSVSGISGRLAIPEVPANKVINLDLRFCKGAACPELRPETPQPGAGLPIRGHDGPPLTPAAAYAGLSL